MISSEYEGLLEAPNTAVLVTLAADGSPHASPVWFLYEHGEVIVSTTVDRQKHRNLGRDPRVAFTVVDPLKPLRYLEIRSSAILADDEGNVIRDRIAVKHGFANGAAFNAPGDRRVNVTLVPTRVIEQKSTGARMHKERLDDVVVDRRRDASLPRRSGDGRSKALADR